MILVEKQTARQVYLDNLRAMMVILVVIMHAAVTYSGFGSWYYIENRHVDLLSAIFFGMYQSFTQAYFMSLLFMLAGYFVPYGLNAYGPKQYIARRLFRLGIPIIIFVFFIHPVVVKLGHPDVILFDYYINGLSTFDFIAWTGPLWFVAVLLVFTLLFVLIKKLGQGFSLKLTSEITFTNIFILIALITLLAFSIRIVYPIGTSVANFQFCYFAAYIFMFSIGIISYYTALFENINYATSKRALIISLSVGLPFWLWLMVVGGPVQGNFLFVNGGFHWQSFAFSLWESFFCVTFIIGLIGLFKHKYNSQSLLQKFLTDNSFGVYVFHAPILTAISVLLQEWVLPPVCKFSIVAVLAIGTSYAFVYLIRKISFWRKILL